MMTFRSVAREHSAVNSVLVRVLALVVVLAAPEALAWPDLRILKTGPAQAEPGEVITYTLAYSNAGPVKSSSVVMKDFLPSNVTVVNGTLNGGTLSGNTISWSIGTLNSKAKGSRSFQVRVGANLVSGMTLTNKSQIFGTQAEEPGDTVDNYSTVITTIMGGNHPPVAQSDSYAINEDAMLSVAAPGVLSNDSDVDGDTLTAVLVNGPAHGTLTLNLDGSFSYTPDPNYHGPDSFTYRANDGTTNSAPVTVSLNVTPVNDAPIAAPDAYVVAEDGALNIPGPGVLGNDSDVDGDTLTAVLVNGPAHGTLTLNPDGSFSYTPQPGYSGGDSFTYQANDGAAGSAVVTVSLAVTPINHAPVAQPDSYAAIEDEILNIAAPGVLRNDTDRDGDPLAALLVSGPSHGVLNFNTNGGFVYTPNPNYHGLDTFTYRASDSATNSAIVTVTLDIAAVNDAPSAQDDTFITMKNVALTVPAPGLLTNDVDPDGDALSVIGLSTPIHGQLVANADGSFVYVPATNYVGSESFTYQANDGSLNSQIATVTITMLPTNSPPNTNTWSGGQFTAYEDTELLVVAPGVLAGMMDIDGDLLVAALVADVSHGTLTLLADGTFTYRADPNYFGPDSFQFLVSDGTTNSPTLTVALTVIPVNDAPAFVPGGNLRIQRNAGAQMISNWARQISPGPANESNQVVTFVVSNSNPHIFVMPPAVNSDGVLTFTPAANIDGTAVVSIFAYDDGGTANGGVDASEPQSFAIAINAAPTVQIVSPTNGASFFVPGRFTVLADAQDSDGNVVQVDFFMGTNRIGIATNTPFFVVLTNLPTGNYTFTAVATDDFGATNNSAPVTVSVIDRPPLTFLSSVYYNPQTDYFEQRVRITNPTYSLLNAVRVMVFNLTNVPAITVGNASGYSNGIPYVETYTPVPPGSYVDMVVEFLSPLRVKPNPTLVAQLVPAPGNPGPLQGSFRPVNRGLLLANRTFFVEFATQSNRVYAIQYSGDLKQWKNAQPIIRGNGNWVQWIDNGLPKTEFPPAEVPARFYRLIQLP